MAFGAWGWWAEMSRNPTLLVLVPTLTDPPSTKPCSHLELGSLPEMLGVPMHMCTSSCPFNFYGLEPGSGQKKVSQIQQ